MWERGARHNPLSYRYQTYRDHRPVLSQDPTLDWLSGRYSDYLIYYFLFNGKAIICSNNIPVADKIKMVSLTQFQVYFNNNLKYFAVIPSVFLSALLFKNLQMPYKILYPLIFYGAYNVSHRFISNYFSTYYSDNIAYYYQKYKHLAVENFDHVTDLRRKHFRLDTDVYYRQTPQEILHGNHEEAHGDHDEGHHDTSSHYGPYPVNKYYFNLKLV